MAQPTSPKPKTRREQVILIGIIILATLLRLGSVYVTSGADLSASQNYGDIRSGGSDEGFTLREATHLIELGEYSHIPGVPSAFRPPLGAFYTAAVLFLTNGNLLAVRLSHVALGAAEVYFVYLIANLLWGRREGVVAALLVAMYPNIVMYTPLVVSENPFVFLFVLFLYLFLRGWKAKSYTWMAAAGLAFGLAALTRSAILGFVVLAWAWLLLARCGSVKQALSMASVFSLCVFLSIVPWTVRNYVTFNRLILISTNGSYVLFHGNNPAIHTPHVWRVEYERGAGTMHEMLVQNVGDPVAIGNRYEMRLMKYTQSAALQYILRHPDRFLTNAVKKYADFWGLERYIAGYYKAGYYAHVPGFVLLMIVGLMQLSYIVAMILSTLGAAFSPGNRCKWILLSFVAYYTAVHMVAIGHSRYRFPLLFIILPFAAYGLVHLGKAWLGIRSNPLSARVLMVSLFALSLGLVWVREVFFIDTGLWLSQFSSLFGP